MTDQEKKKRSIFDLDSFIAGYGLRFIKAMVRKGLSRFAEQNRTLYLQLCRLFRTGDPTDREIVEGFARGAVEVLDGMGDQMPFVPDKVKELFDDFSGDLVTEVRDHFSHAPVTIPDDLPPLEGKEMLERARDELKEFVVGIFKKALPRLRETFDFLKRFGTSNKDRFLNNLLRLGPETVEAFKQLYDGLPSEQQRGFRLHLQFFDEPEEMARFEDMTEDERKDYFAFVSAIEQFDIPEPLRASFTWLQAETDKILTGINRSLAADNKLFSAWADRRIELRKQQAQRRQQQRIARKALQKLLGLGAVGAVWTMLALLAVYAGYKLIQPFLGGK